MKKESVHIRIDYNDKGECNVKIIKHLNGSSCGIKIGDMSISELMQGLMEINIDGWQISSVEKTYPVSENTDITHTSTETYSPPILEDTILAQDKKRMSQ